MNKRFELAKDYTISRVINGCWQLSQGHSLQGGVDRKDVMRAFHMLVDIGMNTFDCADIYTGVEEFIGEFVKELGGGNDIQIHTKYVPDIDALSSVNFAYTERVIDRSLTRLNRDVLDLVQFHWWDYDVPGALDAAGHLLRLREKGKIRHIGTTNFDTENLSKLVNAGIPLVSVQTQYSLFDRRPEKRLLDYCQKNGIAVLCYGTLAGGFLSERWQGKAPDSSETRSQVKYLQVIEDTLGWDAYQRLLALLNDIAKAHDVSIATVASSYMLQKPGVGAAIVGIRNSRHVPSNAQTLAFNLPEPEAAQISAFLAPYKTLPGEPFELERTVGSKYRAIMKMNLGNRK